MPGSADVFGKLTAWTNRKVAGLHALMNGPIAKRLQAEAQQNAPWQDRTGNARQGLHAGAYLTAGMIVLYLAHSMEYGVFLEKARAGRYAILKPTMDKSIPMIQESISRYWNE